jgi:hypothetical protein
VKLLADKVSASAPLDADHNPQQPQRTVYLGAEYVNNKTLADVTFLVEGQPFYAHRIALLASSEAFRAMFNQNFRERDASSIEIPNIRYDVFQVRAKGRGRVHGTKQGTRYSGWRCPVSGVA